MNIKKLSNTKYFVDFDKGDKVLENLSVLFKELDVKLINITSGIGMTINNNINQYDIVNNNYINFIIEEELEVLSLSGNVAFTDDGTIVPHIHGVFSDPRGVVHGGHVKEIETLITIEMFIEVFDTSVTRNLTEERNLKLLGK